MYKTYTFVKIYILFSIALKFFVNKVFKNLNRIRQGV